MYIARLDENFKLEVIKSMYTYTILYVQLYLMLDFSIPIMTGTILFSFA